MIVGSDTEEGTHEDPAKVIMKSLVVKEEKCAKLDSVIVSPVYVT